MIVTSKWERDQPAMLAAESSAGDALRRESDESFTHR